MKPVRVSIVPYLNARPFLLGLRQNSVSALIDLRVEEPAVGARSLLNGSVDLALAPVAVLPQLADYEIISDYCIGCDGPVGSVGICSNAPLEQLKIVYKDIHSMTSNALLDILLRVYWKLDVQTLPGAGGVPNLQPEEGALLIGSRALEHKGRFSYFHDLGAAWKAHTGLPFVFAAWISRTALPEEFIGAFTEALAAGLATIPHQFNEAERHYLTQEVRFELDEAAREGLALFSRQL
jgi:chorismate dehydratase